MICETSRLLVKQFADWANKNKIELFEKFIQFLQSQKSVTLWQAWAIKKIAKEAITFGKENLDQYFQEYQSTSSYRIVMKENQVLVFSPKSIQTEFQITAKLIKGFKYNDLGYWSFPLSKCREVLWRFRYHNLQKSPDVQSAILLLPYLKEQANLKKEQQLREAEYFQLIQKQKKLKQQELWKYQTQELINLSGYNKQLSNGWMLRKYQQAAVEFLIKKRKGDGDLSGAILADEMGLGKTLTALIAARAFQRKTGCRVLVIAPASLLENWRREAAIAEVEIKVFSSARIPPPLESKKYITIFDEAHYYQSLNSQRTKKMMQLAQHENNLAVWLLTGTPVKNGRPANIFPLLKAVKHPLGANRKNFEEKYCSGRHRSIGKNKNVWDDTDGMMKELNSKVQDVLLRRTKKECLLQLPAKSNIFVPVLLDSKTNKSYREEIAKFARNYRQRVRNGEVNAGSEAISTLITLRRIGSNYKVPAALERLEEIEGSVVIFTEFKESAVRLKQELGEDAVLLTGDTRVKDRQALVDEFQRGEAKYFVGTIKAGGVGLTLTQSSNVILVDRPWTPGDCDQAIDRCHRSGQNNAVFAHWLQLGDVDRAIDNLLFEKQDRIEIILNGCSLHHIEDAAGLTKKLMEIL